MSLLFRAQTTTGAAGSAGALWLELAGNAVHSGQDAVAAALALAEHEACLVALEAWLKQPLDPAPAQPAPPGPDHAPGLNGKATPGDAALLWVPAGPLRLGLPWALLAAQAGAPQLPPGWPLEWPLFEFDAEVARFAGTPLPASAAGQRGMLLLPAAFEPAWRVLLRSRVTAALPGQVLAADGQWSGPGSELLLCAAPEPVAAAAATPGAEAWSVLLGSPLRRALPELLGWQEPAEAWRPGAAARLVGPQGSRFEGEIAPALGSAGLWLGAAPHG